MLAEILTKSQHIREPLVASRACYLAVLLTSLTFLNLLHTRSNLGVRKPDYESAQLEECAASDDDIEATR